MVDAALAEAIMFDMIRNGYVDKKGVLTEKYHEDKANGALKIAEEATECADSVWNIVDSVYDPAAVLPVDARSDNVELHIDEDKKAMPEFRALWERISPKSVYVVDFDSKELVRHCIDALNRHLNVPPVYFKVETGAMEEIQSKQALEQGVAFTRARSNTYRTGVQMRPSSSVKYDLVGKLVEETQLTRKDVVNILTGIEKAVFDQVKTNPEEFILRAAALINDEKATAIVQHITYHVLEERYDDAEVFAEPAIKGKLGVNARAAQRHLYDYLVYDSQGEREFSEQMDASSQVAVYVKLPGKFYISTPVGHYNPDWAIAFYEGDVKHIYFVAETNYSLRPLSEEDFLFRRDNGLPMTPNSFTYRFKLILKKYGLPPQLTIHSLRHTCASLQIAHGVDVRTVASNLGHSQTSTTLDIYAHAFDKQRRESQKTLEDVLGI